MKKKTVLAFFAIMFGMMVFANINVSAETYGNLKYRVSNGEVTITGCSLDIAGEVIIPSTIEGYPVTAIGNRVFVEKSNITSVVIPDGVTSIGDYAFKDCVGLVDVYYYGTEVEWKGIDVDRGNECLENATIHYLPIGDANGDWEVSIKDVVSLRRFVNGSYGETIYKNAADVSKDGEVSVRDVVIVRRFVTGGYGVEL